jgi:hypothetical protein
VSKTERPAPLQVTAQSTGTITKRNRSALPKVTRGHDAPGSTDAAAATTGVLDEDAIAGAEADTPNDVSIDTAQAPNMSVEM